MLTAQNRNRSAHLRPTFDRILKSSRSNPQIAESRRGRLVLGSRLNLPEGIIIPRKEAQIEAIDKAPPGRRSVSTTCPPRGSASAAQENKTDYSAANNDR